MAIGANFNTAGCTCTSKWKSTHQRLPKHSVHLIESRNASVAFVKVACQQGGRPVRGDAGYRRAEIVWSQLLHRLLHRYHPAR